MTATIARHTYANLLAEHQPRPIRTQREYRRLLKVAESLTHPALTRDEGIFLDLLGGLLEAYETQHFPCPTPLLRRCWSICSKRAAFPRPTSPAKQAFRGSW